MKTRVDGAIVKVAFRKARTSRRASRCSRSIREPFQAALDQATPSKERDELQLAGAQLDLDRYDKLIRPGLRIDPELDRQRTIVAAFKGLIAADEAHDGTRASLELIYADIRAPFDGRAGTRLVDIGNLVQASQATPLVSITQIKPIFVTFTVPQDVNDAVRRARPPAARGHRLWQQRGRAGAWQAVGDRQPDRPAPAR